MATKAAIILNRFKSINESRKISEDGDKAQQIQELQDQIDELEAKKKALEDEE